MLIFSNNTENKIYSYNIHLYFLPDVLQQTGRPRALTFDPNQHKVLNSELKHLYTAVTRARVNVWIFDADLEKRAPMFEYFKARKLVRCITSEDVDGGTRDFSSPFLGPKFGPIPNAKTTNIFPKNG